MLGNHLNKTFQAPPFGLYHRASAILEFFCRIKWAMISIVLLSTSDRLKPHLTECNFWDQSNPHCTHKFHQCLNGRDDLMCPKMEWSQTTRLFICERTQIKERHDWEVLCHERRRGDIINSYKLKSSRWIRPKCHISLVYPLIVCLSEFSSNKRFNPVGNAPMRNASMERVEQNTEVPGNALKSQVLTQCFLGTQCIQPIASNQHENM